MSASSTFDAVVIGGGPAGLSSALTLGRSCLRVLLLADGPTRNAPAAAAHNLFTRDGTSPADLVRIGREQLAPYDVEIRDARADGVTPADGGFSVAVGDDRERAHAVVLATGLRDELPDVPGMRERWGRTVFHCPFCHGWEVAGQPLGVYARGAVAHHVSLLLLGWSRDLVLFTDGPSELAADERAHLEHHGIAIREERVARLDGPGEALDAVVLETGERVERSGLLVATTRVPRSDLAERLGCDLTDDGHIAADAFGRTSVPGVYAAGDASPAMQQVISAAASGAMAGTGIVQDLVAARIATAEAAR